LVIYCGAGLIRRGDDSLCRAAIVRVTIDHLA
jgi:hypothetical protein